jgi:uncharacterized membrane protein YhaH (DUF805 family)
MKKIWFKRKSYGWGWYPSSWEGWLVLAVYIVLMVKQFMIVDSTSHSGSDTIIGLALPFIVTTVILIGVCYWQGESPRWQWGEKDKNK